jgi:hypothetical protein
MKLVKASVVPRRNGRGGRSAEGHVVAALRCLYKRAEDDGLIAEADNPARKVDKPRRLPSTRRAVPDTRLAEINEAAAAGGNDPELDTLILRLHTETAWHPARPGYTGPQSSRSPPHGLPPGACPAPPATHAELPSPLSPGPPGTPSPPSLAERFKPGDPGRRGPSTGNRGGPILLATTLSRWSHAHGKRQATEGIRTVLISDCVVK